MKVVSWFSAGVSSAIATKLALEKYPDLSIIYIDIDDQHSDSLRFILECENWFNKDITILKSPYACVDHACRAFGYINGVKGAKCTMVLKKRVRKEWEKQNNPDIYIWGMDCSKREQNRASRLFESMPDFKHEFPLIEKNLTKEMVHGMLKETGIKRPVMYELGYPNNNCIGCVKGGMGYWNKIRIDFPDVFRKRGELERLIGASCIKGTYLDELDPEKGRELEPILEDCGIACELQLE
jgi:hypothetical protein